VAALRQERQGVRTAAILPGEQRIERRPRHARRRSLRTRHSGVRLFVGRASSCSGSAQQRRAQRIQPWRTACPPARRRAAAPRAARRGDAHRRARRATHPPRSQAKATRRAAIAEALREASSAKGAIVFEQVGDRRATVGACGHAVRAREQARMQRVRIRAAARAHPCVEHGVAQRVLPSASGVAERFVFGEWRFVFRQAQAEAFLQVDGVRPHHGAAQAIEVDSVARVAFGSHEWAVRTRVTSATPRLPHAAPPARVVAEARGSLAPASVRPRAARRTRPARTAARHGERPGLRARASLSPRW
jgi:hypothetical protein